MNLPSFYWNALSDIRPLLLQNVLGSRGNQMTDVHLQELDRMGRELGASKRAHGNAARLATGYEDLVVVLLEPSDKAERYPYDAMKASSKALQLLDKTLSLAFVGQRNVNNTIILDRRTFRSAEIQSYKDNGTREQNNQKAYQGFEAILTKLHPKVIVLRQR